MGFIIISIIILLLYNHNINQGKLIIRLVGRLSYLARSTPTNLVLDAFKLFDDGVHTCFIDCIGLSTFDEAWCQVQLGFNNRGLGLCLLSLHSSSAFIASFFSSGVYDSPYICLGPLQSSCFSN